MDILKKCVLTNHRLDTPIEIKGKEVIEYSNIIIGKVRIEKGTLAKYLQEGKKHPILAGICRNNHENKIEPPLINEDYLSNTFKAVSYPKSFDEKCMHLLVYLYEKGGKEYKEFKLREGQNNPLCYVDSNMQFRGIMKCIKEKYWMKYNILSDSGGPNWYREVVFTEGGIAEVEKALPKMPLVGLVNQQIGSGNLSNDNKINQARDLFFKEPPTRENMRSACEALIYILEPIREELKNHFNNKDVEAFFTIVNTFDIRHNREQTKRIEHPEQFEWLFYSLLNTINTYSKLKTRLGD